MSTLLTILGTAFLTVVLLALAIWLGIKYFIYRVTKQAGLAASMTGLVPRIHLQPTTTPWHDPARAEALLTQFNALGFVPIGKFEVVELPATMLLALDHCDKNLSAVICEAAEKYLWFDVVNIGEDTRNTIFASNSPAHNPRNHPPTTRLYHSLALSPETATEWVYAHRGAGPWRRIDAGCFVHEFERAYARCMDFQLMRGSPTAEDVRLAAQQLGDGTVYSDEQIVQTVEIQAEQFRHALEEACLDNFLQASALPGHEWERLRESRMVIHDRLTIDQVLDLVAAHTAIDASALQQDFAKLGLTKPAEVFTRVAATTGLTRRLKFLGAVSTPVAARIYAMSAESAPVSTDGATEQ